MDQNDPLLPAPEPLFPMRPWTDASDAERALTEFVLDYFTVAAIAWPAFDSEGNVNVPPPEHVLDHLARKYELVGEEVQLTRPSESTVAVVAKLYPCDNCGDEEGRFDGRLAIGDRPIAAWACVDCYRRFGSGTLGAGGDYYVMTRSEVPGSVIGILNQLAETLGRSTL